MNSPPGYPERGLVHRMAGFACRVKWASLALGIRCSRWLLGSDRRFLDAVCRIGFSRWPRARHHLRHYIDGSGRDLFVETNDLLREDPGVRAWLEERIFRALHRGEKKGETLVPQWAFASFDWRCALGNIRMTWKAFPEYVEYSFREHYAWKPDQHRPSRVAHMAAARSCRFGAKPYDIRGRRCRWPVPLREKAARWPHAGNRVYL